jgi:hypothetical protein
MSSIRITTTAAPIKLELLSSEPAVATIVSSPGPEGAPGPSGPDPWLEPIQDIAASGAVEINYALGKHVRLTLTGNVSSLAVTGWPVANRIARLTLEILNEGNFGILAWPNGTIWQSGSVPEITQGAGARDRIILSTTDGGLTIYGDPVGFDYR